jgi:hypothetical protein
MSKIYNIQNNIGELLYKDDIEEYELMTSDDFIWDLNINKPFIEIFRALLKFCNDNCKINNETIEYNYTVWSSLNLKKSVSLTTDNLKLYLKYYLENPKICEY